MKIHIFSDTFYASQNLQSVNNGMFPVYGDNDIIANIISEDGNWIIKLTKSYQIDESPTDTMRLQQYHVYTIVSKRNKNKYNVVLTPKYFTEPQSYISPCRISIGSNPACDITYPVSFGNQDILTLSFSNGVWIAQANSPNFFSSNGRIINTQIIHCGDFVFYCGFKAILVNDKIIICTPSTLYSINENKFSKLPPARATLPPFERQEQLDDKPLYTEADYFQKAPRINYIIEGAAVKIDEPPAPEKPPQQPLILTIGPQITMMLASGASIAVMVMTLTSSSKSSTLRILLPIITMSITLLGSLLWPTLMRRYNKKRIIKREEKRQNKYKAYLAKKEQHLNFIRENQKKTLVENNPDPKRCVEIARNRELSLWQRNIQHYDFLQVRIGLGEVGAVIDVAQPEEKFTLEDDDNLFLIYKHLIEKSLKLQDAPVSYRLTAESIGAIVGEPIILKQFMDCIFLQTLAFHSYSDLKIIVFTKNPSKWRYLKVVPHCWSNDKTMRYFATTIDNFTTITNSLEKVFDARKANDEEVQEEDDGTQKTASYKDFHPYYLFFIEDIAEVKSNSLLTKILHYKKNLGFSILTTTNSISLLPNETTTFVAIAPKKSMIISGKTNKKEIEFVPDLNAGQIDMDYFARLLANIPVKIEKGKFELPKSLPFLQMYNCGRVEQLNSLARWKENTPYSSLSVPIGVDQNNEVFRMDIHEKAFGPHGLIAGTTGSGKSEWIITYILSLAVNFSPEEVQFVLIDYKGGGLAKSFENSELGVKLPHIAGTITNLDKSEIFRSISAIESELKRRQNIFNEAREKLKEGSMDIYKYQQCYRNKQVDEPLSHLLIISDEFAELKQQQPEFMEQLISTSRIGRSLGVHLILATQKPGGIVNDQIWSNSKFKVALKVQNKSDSNDVIKKPDAAYLKQTGAFYLSVGNDDYYNLGQSAWAGAKYYPSDTAKKEIDSSVQYINELGQIIETLDNTAEEEKVQPQGEQLLNIVQYLSKITEKNPIKSKRLWLDNVKPKMLLSELRKKYNLQPAARFDFNILVGEYDEPRRQEQGPLKINLAGGNICIISKPGASIDLLISSIIWSTVSEHNPAEVAFYIIDFGAETMKKFAKFPQVGEVVFQDETDKVFGVLNLVIDELQQRKEILSEYNGSFEYYNQKSDKKMNLITVVINNYDIFCERLPKITDKVAELFRDAPKCGIVFVISTNAQGGVSSRIQQYFNHIIPMQLASDDNYRGITNCRRGLIPSKTEGRGICKLDPTNPDSYCEFQTARIDEPDKELDTIRDFADKSVEYYKCKVKQLAKIPEDVASTDLIPYVNTLEDVPIGIDLYGKQLAKYNFEKNKVHLIASDQIAQNIEFLYGLAAVLSKTQNTKVRIVDFLNIFKKPILDIQIFEQDKNEVVAALEKDAETRTESQDYGITFIIGAGRFKNVLTAAGADIFRSLMEKTKDSKKNIYLLIDDYEPLRTLKLEKWFNAVDTKNGIWLGTGLDSQSLFDCNEPGNEDKKYNFRGQAFTINDKELTLTKVVLDKDE